MKAFKAGQTAYIAQWVGAGLDEDGRLLWKIESARPVTLAQGGKVKVRITDARGNDYDQYVVRHGLQMVWHEDPTVAGA